ncbi:LPXTG cell wall anchor domain-containing protein [Enterococcus sp. AZ109]|uniref:LPXTG cell wall anchor domain-containing protein n=1 Tax=Enterococcus sp. AZ109 TaxID=2774634 RepID=UPI003F2989E6
MKKKTSYLIGIAAISLLVLSSSLEVFAGESQGSRATVSVLADELEEPSEEDSNETDDTEDSDTGCSGSESTDSSTSESTEPSSSESHDDGTNAGTENSGNKQESSNQGAPNNSKTDNNSNSQNVSHSTGNQHKQYPQTNDRYTPLYSILGGIILLIGLGGIYITYKKKGEIKNEKN